jgi:hypothetical protein
MSDRDRAITNLKMRLLVGENGNKMLQSDYRLLTIRRTQGAGEQRLADILEQIKAAIDELKGLEAEE